MAIEKIKVELDIPPGAFSAFRKRYAEKTALLRAMGIRRPGSNAAIMSAFRENLRQIVWEQLTREGNL